MCIVVHNILHSCWNSSRKGSYHVTCRQAEVTFSLLCQSIKAGTRFSDPGGCKAELTQLAWLHTEVCMYVVYLKADIRCH